RSATHPSRGGSAEAMAPREHLETRRLARGYEERLQQPDFTNGCDEVRDIGLDLRADDLIDWNLTNRLNRCVAHQLLDVMRGVPHSKCFRQPFATAGARDICDVIRV